MHRSAELEHFVNRGFDLGENRRWKMPEAGEIPSGAEGAQWRKRVGVEPTGDRVTCRPPVLKLSRFAGVSRAPAKARDRRRNPERSRGNSVAEASGSRTHHRYREITTAGFEDRDDHRTACASTFIIINLQTTLVPLHAGCIDVTLNPAAPPLEKTMGRHQTGYIFESKSGAFHVRYYATEIVDAQPTRVQKSHLRCHKSNKYYSRTCKEVKNKRDEFMRKINVGGC
jgi:hypothetical protein